MTHQTVPEGRLNWFFQRAIMPRVTGFLFFGAAFYLAYLYGMSFSPACASPFWFPDAVLLCALLMTRPRNWWVFILGALPIRLFSPVAHGNPMWFLLATSAIDSAKGIVTAGLLRRFLKLPIRMETVKEFGMFVLIAVLLVPSGSAFFGAAALHAIGREYWEAWEQWFMGNAIVQFILTPAILYVVFGSRWDLRKLPQKKLVEAGLLIIGLIVTSWLEFNMGMNSMHSTEICFYCPVPLLFWAAIRFGMPGASVGFAIVTFFSVDAAIHGRGFFYAMSPQDTALALQEYLLVRTAPLYLVAILIQQKENVEHSLRESEERFRNVADTAPVAIWTVGTDKLCDFVNRGWLEFTGRTLGQELGTGWTDNLHPEDLRRCVDIYHVAFDARQPFEMEYRLRRHDGKYRWVVDRGVPRYAADGKFLGYIGTVIDVTDRKRAEEARQELVHASRLALVGELTAMVAHELNQPLSAILTNTDAMTALLDLQSAPVEELREILADIRRDDLRAAEAIRRIRALVSKREMEMQSLDMNELVAEVARLARSDALRRGVQIREEYCAKIPAIHGDAVHLQQVMLNLMLNSMDAMKDNAVSERKLLVGSTCNSRGAVEISVRDCGQGIPPENLTRIFNSFFTTKENGMGIGLSMARSIVQMHGGRLWAENNRDGKGTTFRFTLPAIKNTAPAPDTTTKLRGHLAETV